MVARAPIDRERWLLYAAPLIVGWGVYWLAFFPGVVSRDAASQWAQIQTGDYDDMHPAFHTFWMWLLTRPCRSLAVVSATHVVLTGTLAGYLLSAARSRGASRAIVCAVTAWLIVAPVFAMHAIAVGRDTTFALALLWVTTLLLRATERGTVTMPDGGWLGVACALVSLLRHNGAPVAVAILVVFASHFRLQRRGVTTALVTSVALVAVVRGPLYRVVRVRPMTPIASQSFVIHQLGALIAAGTPLEPADREFLETIAPLRIWRTHYKCWNGYPLLFGSGLREDPIVDAPLRLAAIWVRLVARNPRAFVGHWRCTTGFVRNLDSPLLFGPFFGGRSTVAPNAWGLTPTSWLPSVEVILRRLIAWTSVRRSAPRMLVWQPATSLYLLLGALAVAVWRSGSAAPVLVWAPGLSNTAVWLLGIAPAAWVRYQWPVVVLAPLLLALAAAGWPCRRDAGVPRAEAARNAS